MEPADDDLKVLPESLRTLAVRGTLHRYRKGTVLISEGDIGDTLYIVLEGRVKAFSVNEQDREIIYTVHGPGDYFGEMSLDGGPRSASVETLETTRCIMITRKTLHEHIAAYPEFAFELIARVIRRARLATLSARSMALLDVYGRLARLLDELALPLPEGGRVIADMSHHDIATRVGCSREMVTRLLKDLANGGYIEQKRRGITLRRPLPPNW